MVPWGVALVVGGEPIRILVRTPGCPTFACTLDSFGLNREKFGEIGGAAIKSVSSKTD
jgi:hypothetical protein